MACGYARMIGEWVAMMTGSSDASPSWVPHARSESRWVDVRVGPLHLGPNRCRAVSVCLTGAAVGHVPSLVTDSVTDLRAWFGRRERLPEWSMTGSNRRP